MATHIVGGNIHYEYEGGDNYLIQLYVYRDCASSSTDFDDPAAVGVFDINGNLVMNVEIPISDAVITDVPVDTGNPCLDPPEGICVKEAIYSATVNLPPIVGGYTLVYQRCCRNTTLVNTESNDDLGITLYAEIPGSEVVAENSNPLFNEYPPVVICLNQPFVFDHSASDLDADELVYEFCNPLLTDGFGFYINPPGPPPFPELQFYPEFDYEYPIESNPAFAIDPVTGVITGTPTALGQYVVGICVKEYRDGELIATMNRDFQFNVTLCEVDVIASIPEQTAECDGLTIEFINNSVNADWYFWDFGVEGIESDTSIEVNPVFTFPDIGEYTITLIANPGLSCSDTATTVYTANPNVEPEIFPPEYECDNGQSVWNFEYGGDLPNDVLIEWDFGPNAEPGGSFADAPQGVIFDEGSTVTVILTATEDDCVVTDEWEIDIPFEPVAIIEPQETFCDGLTYVFGNNSLNAEEYAWDFGFSSTDADESSEFEPEMTFPDPDNYFINLVATAVNTCPDETTIEFAIYGDLSPSFENPGPQCLVGNSFDFFAEGATTLTATYLWEFEQASIPNSASQNVENVTYSTPGYFDVSLTISENGCTETYLDSVWLVEAPILDFSLEYAEGCPPLSVHFQDLSTSSTVLQYDWNFGDGGASNAASPIHVYNYPGMYDVTLTISAGVGCVTTLTQTLNDAVHVYPVPTAYFAVDPIHVTILEPTVNITDLSEGSISCEYYTSDGGYLTDCNTTYDWTEAGHQTVVQWVTNEWGCRDSIGHIVVVEGFLFYAPNAFTPNQDGYNDVWLPESTGVLNYDLQIYNRWGEVVFATTDPRRPWIGNVDGGDHYAQDGIYTYQVVVEDLLSNPHVFVGHISLLR